MPIKTRNELYATFVNGAIPSQGDFRDLIDSMISRRDDHFFGLWQKGMKYCKGDVVIYGKSLYMLANPDLEDDCPPEENGNGGDEDGANGPKPTENGCICSTEPPDVDVQRWCPLELVVDDEDWQKLEVDGEVMTVYNLKARIGIGTDQPQSRLEVTESDYGSIQLEPDRGGFPALSLVKIEGAEQRVDYQIGTQVEWVTDALGYAFFRRQTAEDSIAASSAKVDTRAADADRPVLLFITSSEQGHARVSIGHDDPRGTLDALQPERGQLILNPGAANEPGILLTNLEPAGNGHYLLSGISQQSAFLQTDAVEGFRLRKGPPLPPLLKADHLDEGESLVAVKGNGHVGVGTEDPRSKLEVHDPDFGAIRLDLSNNNPKVSIINQRPDSPHPVTYHAVGVDDDAGTFISNAPDGFVFKKGGSFGNYNNEVNINQGDKLVYIGPTGKVGVQTIETPEDYDLEVEGRLKSLTAHLETDGANIEQTGELAEIDVLSKIDKLYPILFKWKQHTGLDGEGDQYGFNAQNVFEVCPQLVKKSGGNKAVAYGNMAALLVQAIKDQQVLIKQLEQRVCDLEDQLGQ